MNRIAVVSMIKNEADIIESSIRHWACFSDKIFVCDHKSTDRTRFILDSLREEGLNLEISTHDSDEKAQMEVTNKLIQKALEEGFDLILPLDADELPIFINGNSKDLRAHLQNLDTSHGYQTYCWEHRFADESHDKFALSRKILREPNLKFNYPKVIIGAGLAKKFHVHVSYGNHALYVDGKPPNYSVILDQKIFYAHFGYRSSNQMTAKRVTDYLGTRLQVTRYNCRGEGSTPEEMADRYFSETPPKLDLTGFISTDLSAYKDEAVNKFSGGGGVNPSHALFLLASSYAETLVRERILEKQEIVRIFLLFDGNIDLTIQSLDSILKQTYEFTKIFVVLMNRDRIGELILAMKDRSEDVEFVDRSEFRSKLESPDGSYIQIVRAGDILSTENIFQRVEDSYSDSNENSSRFFYKQSDSKNIRGDSI